MLSASLSARIKKEILPVVTSLCQDVDYEVRACMCKQLDSVARGLGWVHKLSILCHQAQAKYYQLVSCPIFFGNHIFTTEVVFNLYEIMM